MAQDLPNLPNQNLPTQNISLELPLTISSAVRDDPTCPGPVWPGEGRVEIRRVEAEAEDVVVRAAGAVGVIEVEILVHLRETFCLSSELEHALSFSLS